jgi:predicted ABC-type ATPase
VAERKPLLVVLAGPNGSGKTSLTDMLRRRHDWTDGLVVVNPDEIAEEEFGSWNDPSAILKAANKAEAIREDCLQKKRGLLFETVLSTPGKVDFIKRAKAAGFFVRLIYVGTNNPEINLMRIAWRKALGGHDVPEEKVISRYERSMKLAVEAARSADRAYFVDNSLDVEAPEDLAAPYTVFRTIDGVVAKTYVRHDEIPSWCEAILKSLRPSFF